MAPTLLLAPSLLLCALFTGSHVEAAHSPLFSTQDEVNLVQVGHRSVKGKMLKPFDSKWTGSALSDEARITEKSAFQRIDGKKLYVRRQVFPMQQGLSLQTTVCLDPKTLRTVRLEQEVLGLPAGAGLGQAPEYCRWDFDGAKYERLQRHAGEEQRDSGSLDEPMFDGGALGLVLAALPLKDGYRARLPICMPLNLSPELTRYWVDVRVVGKEPFEGPRGKTVEAWVVAVDWLDFESEKVTSKGGYDEPGGAYFVVPKPPKGFPHVPRYANAGGVIELDLE